MILEIQKNNGIGLIIILAIALIILLIYIKRRFKALKLPCVFLITGAPKTLKTGLSVNEIVKRYKKNLHEFYFLKFFATLIGKGKDFTYPPMLYSNLPLAGIRYNVLTRDIIEMKVRIPNKSCVLIDESSMLADSMLFNDPYINNSLTRFYKLFGHYTHGGTCILNTQSPKDNHFSAKRVISNFLYIHHVVHLPIISFCYVREMLNIDDEVVNNVDKDIELSLRKIIIFNRRLKMYDKFAFSSFTDYLPYEVDYDVPILNFKDDLKIYNFVTYQQFGLKMNEDMAKHLEELQLYDKSLVLDNNFDENGVLIENEKDKDI